VFFIRGLESASPPTTQGGSPVRELRTPGSVRGALSNECPYRDTRAYKGDNRYWELVSRILSGSRFRRH
ncbi:MAG: hypothetical protein ABI167_10470, partial [Nitrosospira sp.]